MARRKPRATADQRRGVLPCRVRGHSPGPGRVLLETFIIYEDKVGLELQQVLIEAARRGVRVQLLVDATAPPS